MNFFSVLDNSDNEDDVKVVPKKTGKEAPAPAKKDAAPAKKDAAAPAKKDAAAPAKKDAAPAKKAEETKPKGKENAPAANGGKAKEHKVSHAAANAADADRDAVKEDNRGGNRNRERHGGRGAGRGDGEGERRPKREFDRKSGTGRGREVSRGGRGAFGAGNPAQDALEAEKNPKAAAEGAVDGVADAIEEEAAPVEEETPAEPEPVTFTMDEFMRKREEARQKLAEIAAAPVPRVVNREAEFAGMTTLATALDDYVSAGITKTEAGRKDQRSTGKTPVLNVGFKFPTVQPEREGGGRGGRGEGGRGGRGGDREGGRGGRREGRGEGRGAPRAPRSAAAFNPADFPSL